MTTWTFMGHWSDSDELELDFYVEGQVEDRRIDTGRWEGGLFSDSGTGEDPHKVWDAIKRSYEADVDAG
ncbi:hypothetical protein [Mycolicibacterium fortuitum]|uniref:hypothetical protein n=1 Tax=Mycolicibacterium fortuitum TaxID=1766 RepID=UPI002616B42A|nr:hypothetical protein [Mycolicibacterium fortuitum]